AWRLARAGRRGLALGALGSAAVVFLGVVAGWGVVAVDDSKAPRPLMRAMLRDRAEPEIRVGCYDYFQPSLVFYAGRDVAVLGSEEGAAELLRGPVEAYLFLPAADWDRLRPLVPAPCRLLGRHRDLYRRCDVVVVTNR
ncbi:MAG TPA: hypothetical protein VFW33_12720, partial [Gemmataceae bacterium]|nr:hypothetical protein [Gemmataceae bacterium]